MILAALWRNNFVRTPFHILLSGLAFADLCTGVRPTFLFCDVFDVLSYAAVCCVVLDLPLVSTNTSVNLKVRDHRDDITGHSNCNKHES